MKKLFIYFLFIISVIQSAFSVVNAIQSGNEGDSQEVIQEILNIYKMSSGKPKS